MVAMEKFGRPSGVLGVMPALAAGIHVLNPALVTDVDGRAKGR
jgi:hypothetical protein